MTSPAAIRLMHCWSSGRIRGCNVDESTIGASPKIRRILYPLPLLCREIRENLSEPWSSIPSQILICVILITDVCHVHTFEHDVDSALPSPALLAPLTSRTSRARRMLAHRASTYCMCSTQSAHVSSCSKPSSRKLMRTSRLMNPCRGSTARSSSPRVLPG